MARVDLKVVLLGSASVGKSCLLDRWTNGVFESHPKNTIGAAFAAKKVRVKSGRWLALGVWDTAGAERFEALSRLYYTGSAAAIICFDCTQRHSFLRAQAWVVELKVQVPQCRIFLAVTKCDRLEDPPTFSSLAAASAQAQPAPGNGSQSISSVQDSLLSEASSTNSHESPDGQKQPADVSMDEIEAFAVQRGAQLFATSAKSGFGVAQLFKAVAETLADSIDPQPPPQPPVLELPVPLLPAPPSRQISRQNSANTPRSSPGRQRAGACCS